MTRKIITSLIIACISLHLSAQEKKLDNLTITDAYDYYPYSFINSEGHPDGLVIDLWKLWGKRNNVRLNFQLVQWNNSLDLIKIRKADIHGGLLQSKERDAFMDFGELNIPLETAIFVSENLEIKDMAELKNIPIAAQHGDYVVGFLKENFPFLTISQYDNVDAMVRDLRNEKISAIAYDIPQIVYFTNRYNLLGKMRLFRVLYSKTLSFGVADGNTDLIRFVNRGMEKITDADRNDLLKKWAHYGEHAITAKLLIKWIVIAAGIILFVFFIVNTIALKLQVRKKTSDLQKNLLEKEKLIGDLQYALNSIKTLQGLLPICSFCKKIRNDNGYWEQVEDYIKVHSNADFSHSLCPSCAEKLYGDQDWYKDGKK